MEDTVICPACCGKKEFVGIGLHSVCKRCFGLGVVSEEDFVLAVKQRTYRV
jgi:hypothetical protein